jgi:uncharacterized membrane protein YgdD (TMEM256/DUF423 family)
MPLFVALAGLLGFLGVGLGAFGAHLLKNKLSPELFNVYQVAVQYHFIHTLALLAVAWITTVIKSPLVGWAGWMFVFGICIFSGSLYILALTGARGWGAVTPIGGVAFLAGWLLLTIAALKTR